MKTEFSEKAEKELGEIDKSLRELFIKHAEKIALMPPTRHMRFDLPFNVEEVTRQARMVYNIEEETCYILHCFKNHKEYERWYKSFK
jgi:mRNA-degrading endonuclease RelE of RelBE toxin-antitoxin system